jgi:hypothetical protein
MQQPADALLMEDCIVLYHQTSPENAEAIIRSGMKPGPPFPLSHGGSGLYFAPDPLVIACYLQLLMQLLYAASRLTHIDWFVMLRGGFSCSPHYESISCQQPNIPGTPYNTVPLQKFQTFAAFCTFLN